MLFGIAYPDIIVPVLSPSIRIDTPHGSIIGLDEILMLPTQAYPSERAVSIIKHLRSHYILHIGWKYKSVLFILAILGYFLYTSIKYGLHKGITVIKEVGSSVHQCFDKLKVPPQTLIHKLPKFTPVLSQHACPFIKSKALRAIAAVIGHMGGCLVRE